MNFFFSVLQRLLCLFCSCVCFRSSLCSIASFCMKCWSVELFAAMLFASGFSSGHSYWLLGTAMAIPFGRWITYLLLLIPPLFFDAAFIMYSLSLFRLQKPSTWSEKKNRIHTAFIASSTVVFCTVCCQTSFHDALSRRISPLCWT